MAGDVADGSIAVDGRPAHAPRAGGTGPVGVEVFVFQSRLVAVIWRLCRCGR